MTKRDRIVTSKEQMLLRLDLYLNGNNVYDGELSLSPLSDVMPVPDLSLSDERLCELACRIYESRRLRARFLSSSLLGEPVWDMLLALYCFAARGEAMSVSGLCYAAGVPATTALRWVQIMEQKKLIVRSKDETDGRRVFLSLTEDGNALMKTYLASIHNTLTA